MAKSKVTITLDREKAAEASRLVGTATTSEVIDIALTRLIDLERTRRDVAAYLAEPFAAEELRIADLDVVFDLDDDDVDYESLYG
jgi:hypothetical protein